MFSKNQEAGMNQMSKAIDARRAFLGIVPIIAVVLGYGEGVYVAGKSS